MSKYIFGVDLGGTTAKIGMFTKNGEIVEKWEIPTNKADSGSHILPDIAASVTGKIAEKNITRDDVLGIGIGVPGPVDNHGIIHKAANLGWTENFDLEKALSDLTGIKVKGANDANIAALGEMWKGSAEGYSDIVMVTLGTGIGGGVVCDGKVVTGSVGAGGEIGHIHINDEETKPCGCGNLGCFEQYASATGISRLATERLLEDDKPSVLRSFDKVTAKEVFDGVKSGDEVAIEIANRFGYYLGKGLGIVGTITNPEVFVIGGGVSKAGDILISFVEENYKKFAFHACRNAKFVIATLGNDAGIYGAAKLVVE